MTSRRTPVFVVAAALFACLLPAQTAPKITTPTEALGFNLGDDYQAGGSSGRRGWGEVFRAAGYTHTYDVTTNARVRGGSSPVRMPAARANGPQNHHAHRSARAAGMRRL